MQEKSSHSSWNLLIAVAIIIALGAAGYFYETRDKTSDADLLTSSPSGSSVPVEGDLLTALGQLRKLSLDESVFSDPIFKSFTDYGKELAPQPAGRPNPFAPFATSTSEANFTGSSVFATPPAGTAPVAQTITTPASTAPASTTPSATSTKPVSTGTATSTATTTPR